MMRRVKMAVIVLLVVALVGCRELTDEAKAILGYTAITAKERAGKWEFVRTWLTSQETGKEAVALEYGALHANDLNSQARGLSSLFEAATRQGSALSEAARTQLAEQSDTSKKAAENFRVTCKNLTFKPGAPQDWAAFTKDHQDALDGLTLSLCKISALAPVKKKKEAVKPVATP